MMNGYGMGLSWVWPLLLVVGLGVLVWGLVRASPSSSGGGESATGRARAREILQERFARGEITEQELRERLRVLDDS